VVSLAALQVQPIRGAMLASRKNGFGIMRDRWDKPFDLLSGTGPFNDGGAETPYRPPIVLVQSAHHSIRYDESWPWIDSAISAHPGFKGSEDERH
jgi:hypothetical protein